MRKKVLALVLSSVIGFSIGLISSNVISKEEVKPVTIIGENTEWQGDVGDRFYELSDGSYFVINTTKDQYIFQPTDLGDWDYELDNIEQLNNIVKTYISIKNTGGY